MSRIRANQITNQSADGAPTVQNGLVISGVTTSTTFSGSGASLTNIPSAQLTGALPALDGSNLTGLSGVSVANQSDNRLITATGTTDALNGEANLTFDGSSLDIFNGSNSSTIKLKRHASTASEQAHIGYFSSGLHIETRESTYISLKTNTQERLRIGTNGALSINYAGDGDNTLHIGCTSNAGGIIIKAPGNHYANIVTDSNRSGANNGILNLAGRWNGNDVAYISFTTGTDTSNKDDGYIRMYTRESGQSLTERVQIKEAGGFVSNKGGGNIAFSDGYSAIEARAPEGTTQLTVTNTTYESGTFDNEAGIWFKGNYSGNNERAKSAIIHKNTGDYGVGDLYFCLDGTGDNSNATVSDVKMKINSSGQVTKPYQASFAAMAGQNGYTLNGQVLPFNTTTHNIGSHFNTSNYRFTAPVAGRYLFTFYSILNSSGQGRYEILINGAADQNGTRVHMTPNTSNWDHVSTSWILNLAANDYIQMGSQSNTGWHGGHWQRFCGELLS